MFIKTHILGSYQRVDEIGRNFIIGNRRSVLAKILTDQFAISCVNLRAYGHDWVPDLHNIRRVPKQVKKVYFDSTEKKNNKVNKYSQVPQKAVFDASEHSVKM